MSRPIVEAAPSNTWSFLSSTGEMDGLTRAKDWAAHPLGDPRHWPSSLKTLLGTVLSNRFPQFIFWGPALYCFYNDAYRPSLGKEGKHPAILGMRAEEAWPEIWTVIKPLIDQVMAGGGGTWSEDQLIPIYRNGRMEDVYWTFSYSPITDDEGVRGVLVTCVETTEKVRALHQLKESAAALRTSEQRYQSFMQQSSEGIWRCEVLEPMPVALSAEAALDWVYEHGYLAECNDAMARMYGHAQGADLIGARLGDLMPRSADNEAYLKAFIKSGFKLVGGESEEVDKDGRTIHFTNNLVGIVENGHLVRAWGTQLEITERKRAEQALREVDRRKDEFLATLAHELRNPLTPLMNGLALLPKQGEPVDAQAVWHVHDMMERQMKHMVRLIDDLMDISRISRGKIGLRKEPLDLVQVLDLAAESSRALMEEADHALDVSLPNEPLPFEGDAVRLAQVFLNLLNNAAKYTRPGGRIQFRAVREGDHALVTVEDNGIGLSQEHLRIIFEMFTQVRDGQGHYRDGLGIGLSLVKQLVELHDGTVEAHSGGLGKGTTLRVRLPLRRDPARGTPVGKA